jgi:hypothetical protein
MRAVRARWSSLKPGDLFQTRDDSGPVRVIALHPLGVWIRAGQAVGAVLVLFRPGVIVDWFPQAG